MRSQYRHVVTGLFLIVMLGAALAGLLAPYRNWDMLGYVASVLAWRLESPEAIYQATMSTVASTSPDWLVSQLAANPLSSNAANFIHVLPLYQVKPFYNVALWLVSEIAGIPLSAASSTVSGIAFAILSVILATVPLKECPRPVWLTAVLALAFVGTWPLATIARMSTPDSLCAVFTMIAAFGLLTRRELLFASSALLATLTRPDVAIPMGLLAAWSLRDCWTSPRGRTWMIPAACLALLVLTQWAIGHFAHAYAFEKMFYYNFLNKTPAIASLPDDLVSTDAYLAALSYGVETMLSAGRFWAVAGMGLLGAAAHYLIPAPSVRRPAQMLVVIWFAFIIRFAIWPAGAEDRFYYGYFLISLYCSLELLAPCGKVAHAALLGARARLTERYRSLGEKPGTSHI